MAGHVVTERLRASGRFEVVDASRSSVDARTVRVDLTEPQQIMDLIKDQRPDVVINCVGMLIKSSEADVIGSIRTNALLPHLLVQACDKFGGRLVHLSTDCVFSGKGGPYKVGDFRDGDSVYDRTKALGEVVNERDLTIRTSITGPELRQNGTGLFHWFMMQNGKVKGFANAYWSGLMTTELARCIELMLISDHPMKGLVHLTVPDGISKYALLQMFDQEFERGIEVERFEGEKVDKRLVPSDIPGIKVKDYADQISDMHIWMRSHPELYGHYERR